MLKRRFALIVCVLMVFQLLLPAASAAPGTVSGAAYSGYASVKVTWGAEADAVSYTLYRGSNENELTQIASGLTVLSYTDTGVSRGDRPWYRVDVVSQDEQSTGVPFQADFPAGLEALRNNANIYYEFEGEDALFDGTRTIDKTEDLSKVTGLRQGTVIVRARYSGTIGAESTYRTLFGMGNSTNDSTKQIVIGAARKAASTSSPFSARYEFCDGLYSTAMQSVMYDDQKWHTLAFTAGDGYVRVSVDGVSGTIGSDGYYASSGWNGFITRAPDLTYFTVGGFSSPNNRSYAYANWIGEIDFIAITDEVLDRNAADALTGSLNTNVSVTLSGATVQSPQTPGETVGDFALSGVQSGEASLVLPAGLADNDLFTLEGMTLKTADVLDGFAKYTVIARVTQEGKEPVDFSFIIGTLGIPEDPTKPIIDVQETLTFPPSISYAERVALAKDLEDLTITVQFMQTTSSIGSFVGFSDGTQAARHFHVYANGATLGYELRGLTSGSDISAAVSTLRANGLNTIAFKADSNEKTFKLFANGKLIDTKTLTASTYRMIKDIRNGINTIDIGKTSRASGSNTYPYSGYIFNLQVYGVPLSDDDLIAYTASTPADEEGDAPAQIFKAGDDTGSLYFRIPALYTLNDGTVMAAIDARFGGNSDSPNNLDTVVRYLPKDATEWSAASFPFHFDDYADASGYTSASASYIDPTIVQGNDGTIYIGIDAFPTGGGYPSAIAGSGMVTVDGTNYLALAEKGKSMTTWSNFTYYIKDGVVYNGSNAATEYTVDENFILHKNGEMLYVNQKYSNGSLTGKQVPMSIFYADADLQLFRTSFYMIKKSTDNGATWSAPIILNDLKRESERFMGTGPGRGHVITKGAYAGRILLPIYDDQGDASSGTLERSSLLYSDDNGQTWARSNRVTMASSNSPNKASEAQLVELPDGTIRIYARGTSSYIGYADSFDGGVTFNPMQNDRALVYSSNCMISAINYSALIDGKPAIILSAPEGSGRNNGIIRIGLINENEDPEASGEKYTVDWTYKFSVNKAAFSYSCLTELPNGDIALLYEGPNTDSFYSTYTINELKAGEPSSLQSFAVVNDPVPGGDIRVAMELKAQLFPQLSKLDAAHLTIAYSGSDLPEGVLTYEGVGEDGKTLYFKGTLPESNQDLAYTISIPGGIVLYTLNGLFVPVNADVITGVAAAALAVTALENKTGADLVAGYAANIRLGITGNGLAGKDIVVSVMDGGTMVSSAVYLAESDAFDVLHKITAPIAAGTYTVTAGLEGQSAAQCPLKVLAYSDNIWTPDIVNNDGQLRIVFEVADVVNKNKTTNFNGLVTIGSFKTANAVITQSEGVSYLDVADYQYGDLKQGDKIVISQVKYPLLFPSYSFTFTLSIP